MIKRLILFLVRMRLGVKKREYFRFTNQKNKAVYFFSDDGLVKIAADGIAKSRVSLNWLLDDNCKIKRYDGA